MTERRIPSKEFLVSFSLLADAFLVFLADLTAFFVRFGWESGPFPRPNFHAYLGILFPVIVLRLACFYVYGLYDRPKYKSDYDISLNVIKADTISTLIIIVVAFMFRAFAYPRTVILLSWILVAAYIIIWRLLTRRLINRLLGKNYFISHVLIVGTDREALRLATRLVREANISRKLIGFVEITAADRSLPDNIYKLGKIEDLPRIIKEHTIDEVVIASPDIPKEIILDVFSQFSGTDVIFRIVPNLYEATIGSMASSPTEKIPLISPTLSQKGSWYPDLKRLLDTTGAILGLILLSPLFLLITLLIKLTSAGPVLYRQQRAGRHSEVFTLYKFRTMITASERNGPVFAREDDERVTAIGRFLRRFRLDELPQLYNVLINDMSLIGPRPERPFFVKELIRKIPFYAERMAAKPGITGWAQVTYGYSSTLREHQEKLLYDIFYLENMSLALDLLIIIKTLGVLIRGNGVK
jgi:exopolysaccharide biosynthesis polyprenyl glycosylphosphotransferase